MNSFPSALRRISVVGCSGAGKTTLGRDLARRLTVPAVDLDELIWLPGWQLRAEDDFKSRVRQVLQSESWVISGNYSRLRPEIWARAETVIWLDYSRFVVMKQILWRTFGRNLRGHLCCNGNLETWRNTFSRDSIVIYAWKTHIKRRREYPEILRQYEAERGRILRFRSPRQSAAWLASK